MPDWGTGQNAPLLMEHESLPCFSPAKRSTSTQQLSRDETLTILFAAVCRPDRYYPSSWQATATSRHSFRSQQASARSHISRDFVPFTKGFPYSFTGSP